jgi:hypothetical protein
MTIKSQIQWGPKPEGFKVFSNFWGKPMCIMCMYIYIILYYIIIWHYITILYHMILYYIILYYIILYYIILYYIINIFATVSIFSLFFHMFPVAPISSVVRTRVACRGREVHHLWGTCLDRLNARLDDAFHHPYSNNYGLG